MTEQCECDVTVDEARRGRGRINRYCPRYFEHLSDSQAKTMREQADRIRELIRERNAAKGDAEKAFHIAVRYARQAGLNIAEEELWSFAEGYDNLAALFDKQNTELGHFYDAIVFRLNIKYLKELAKSGKGLAPDEVERVSQFISACTGYVGSRSKPTLPKLPQVSADPAGSLFDEAA